MPNVRLRAGTLQLSSGFCKKILRVVLMLVALYGLSAPQANANSNAVQMIKATEKKDWTKAYGLARASNDPLLMKMYQWKRYQSSDVQAPFYEMAEFLTRNVNWPNRGDIQVNLEANIRENDNPLELSAWFDANPPLSVDGVDYYARSLLRQGKEQELTKFMSNWWATTQMSRDDQVRIFGQYRNFIPLSAHRLRFDQLLFNRNYSNARAVAKVLGNGYPELAEARIALAERKGNVDAAIRRVPERLQQDPGLVYERLRWRRKKGLNDRAIQILENPPPYEQMANPDAWWRERHIIIRRLLEEGRYQTAYRVAARHVQKDGFSFAQAEWLTGWLALRYMKQPSTAYERFQSLEARVSTPVSLARALYWQGRAAEAMKATTISNRAYQKAASYQTVYYGQLAGHKIGKLEALKNAAPPTILPSEKTNFSRDDLIRAARFFHQADHDKTASLFLLQFSRVYNTPKSYFYAITVAQDLGRQHDVVKIAKEATRKGLFVTLQSYPLVGSYLQYAHKGVNPSLINALIRQESQFNPKAQSHAGALGLMQLMPATAKQVARQNRLSHQTAWLTSRPGHNVRLGSAFLYDLMQKYSGNMAMAAAAYNAGPGNVDKWIKQFGDPRQKQVDIIDWIELIPIYETRNYVQRVMEGYYIYNLLPK